MHSPMAMGEQLNHTAEAHNHKISNILQQKSIEKQKKKRGEIFNQTCDKAERNTPTIISLLVSFDTFISNNHWTE